MSTAQKLRSYVERRFSPLAVCPDEGTIKEFQDGEGIRSFHSATLAVACAETSFDHWARGRNGSVFWMTLPQIIETAGRWRFYMKIKFTSGNA